MLPGTSRKQLKIDCKYMSDKPGSRAVSVSVRCRGNDQSNRSRCPASGGVSGNETLFLVLGR
ncbi:hypothetical protein BCEP27_20813 [Burkholderia cepacia]